MKIHIPLFFILFFVSCKTREFNSRNEIQSRANAKKCFTIKETEEKIDCLNQWIKTDALASATGELQSQFRIGVPLNYYGLSICGPQNFDSRPAWLPAQLDVLGIWTELDTNRQVELFTRQIQSSVAFLKMVHKAMHGIPNGWFKEVVICPRKMLDGVGRSPLQLMSGTLIISIREQQGGYQVITENEILRLWNLMDFESDIRSLSQSLNSKANKMAEKIWLILNPLGTFRTTARATLFDKRDILLSRLQNSLKNTAEKSEIEVKDILVKMASDSSDSNFVTIAQKTQLTRQKALCVAKLLQKNLSEVSTWQSEANCTNSIFGKQIKNSRKISNTIHIKDVAVYVGNLHSISVGLNTCDQGMEKHTFGNDPNRDQFTQNVSIERAAVAVHTVDDISVSVNSFVFPALASQVLGQTSQCP